MRPIWKGAISFGLVNIPIALYPAARREEFKFRSLRASDLSPVNYKRVAEADGKEVPWDQIVKGYEYEKEKFVALKDEDFRRADIEARQTVNIINFVDLQEVAPVLFDKPYYMEPGQGRRQSVCASSRSPGKERQDRDRESRDQSSAALGGYQVAKEGFDVRAHALSTGVGRCFRIQGTRREARWKTRAANGLEVGPKHDQRMEAREVSR